MRRILSAIALFFAVPLAHGYMPQEGDVVFQTSLSRQSIAIQKATRSVYSHVGIVLFRQGRPYVFEAVQPVKFTPLKTWLARGRDARFVAMRARKPLTASAIAVFHRQARKYVGRPYDLTFEWSDTRMYCSELVWKLYNAAGIELAPLSRLGNFDLDDPEVKRILKKRYGSKVPLDEPVMAPSAISDSPLLVTVASEPRP